MRIHRGPTVVFALALTILIAVTTYPSRRVASGQGPKLNVSIIRTGPDWRTLIAPGQTITVDIGVSNLRGDAAAHDTALTVLLPSGLSVVQSRPAPAKTETTKDGIRLTWNLGVIEAGAFPRLFDLDLQAVTDVKKGTELAIEASVSTTDAVVDESSMRSAFVLSVGEAAAALIVESNLDSVPFTTDAPVDFTVDVKNLGTISASACTLTMTLPPKITFESSDPPPADHTGNRVTWKFGDLAQVQSHTVKIRIVLDAILRAAAYGFAPKLGNLKFAFDAATATNIVNPDHGHLEIAKHPEPAGSNVTVSLNVAEVEHPGGLRVGSDVTYEIVYGNYGNAAATQVSLSLTLPQGLDPVDAVPVAARSTKNDKSGASTLSWDLGDLGVGESGEITSRIHVTSIGADGCLVSAAISAEGNDVHLREKTAYSLQHAAKR
jgi:uncharacterized repeat protein (TIGR01451 family)